MLAARRLPKQLGESLPHGGANSAYKCSVVHCSLSVTTMYIQVVSYQSFIITTFTCVVYPRPLTVYTPLASPREPVMYRV